MSIYSGSQNVRPNKAVRENCCHMCFSNLCVQSINVTNNQFCGPLKTIHNNIHWMCCSKRCLPVLVLKSAVKRATETVCQCEIVFFFSLGQTVYYFQNIWEICNSYIRIKTFHSKCWGMLFGCRLAKQPETAVKI